MKNLASFLLPERCEYVERIITMLETELKENPKVTTVIPFDLIKYIVLPYITYTPLDFYDVTIDETPCLYQSFKDEIYEKVLLPQSIDKKVLTFEELDELAKTLDRQFLIREGYLYPDEDDYIDPSLDDRGNICARFKYEVGYLIRLTPKYKSVSQDHFEPRTTPLETITLNYPDDLVFSQHVKYIMQPVYHRVYHEIQTYNKQVMNYLASFRSDPRCDDPNADIFGLCVKCLTHLRYRPELNNLMTMMINDPDMIKIVKEEGIKLVFYDEDEE